MTEYFLCNASPRSLRRTTTFIDDAGTPERISAAINASPIVPAPMMPT